MAVLQDEIIEQDRDEEPRNNPEDQARRSARPPTHRSIFTHGGFPVKPRVAAPDLAGATTSEAEDSGPGRPHTWKGLLSAASFRI